MVFGSETTSSSDRTASVLHVPDQRRTHTDLSLSQEFVLSSRFFFFFCFNLPRPASFGMTQSPTLTEVTRSPTSTTSATPSLPPTAGRSGKMAYVPGNTHCQINDGLTLYSCSHYTMKYVYWCVLVCIGVYCVISPCIMLISDGLTGAARIFTWTSFDPTGGKSMFFNL